MTKSQQLALNINLSEERDFISNIYYYTNSDTRNKNSFQLLL